MIANANICAKSRTSRRRPWRPCRKQTSSTCLVHWVDPKGRGRPAILTACLLAANDGANGPANFRLAAPVTVMVAVPGTGAPGHKSIRQCSFTARPSLNPIDFPHSRALPSQRRRGETQTGPFATEQPSVHRHSSARARRCPAQKRNAPGTA